MAKIEQYQIILDTVRQQYASVIWTHKIQEKQADIYGERYRLFETLNILSAALTSCGIIACIFEEGIVYRIITAILSFITIFIAAYNKSFDLKALAGNNKVAANQLIGIRNEMLQIISDLHLMNKQPEEINGEFVKLMKRLNKLYVEAPTTTDEAVKRATEGLREKNEYTYTDDEIDCFLPPILRGKIKEQDRSTLSEQTEKE